MGWYIRKSKSVGPVRLNLSKSGIGVSTGIKGARISTGPRGTFLNAGSHGIYYRKKIGGRNSAVSKRKAPSMRTTSGKLPVRVVLMDIVAVLMLLVLVGLIFDISSLNSPATLIAPCLALSFFVIAAFFVTNGYKQGNVGNLKIGRILLALSICLILVSSTINSAIDKTTSNLNNSDSTNSYDITLVSIILITVMVVGARIWHNLSWNLSSVPGLDDEVTAMVKKAILRPSASRMVAFVLLWIGVLGVGYEYYGLAFVAVLGILVLLYSLVSLVSCRANLNYNLDQDEESEWDRFCEAFSLLQDSKTVWVLHDVYDSGESAMSRYATKIDTINAGFVSILRIKADCKVCFIKVGSWKYVFLPDRIIVSKGWKVASFPLEVFSLTKSIEIADGKNKAYSDAGIHVGSMHWLHETKDGGPDLRFKDNPMSVAYELEALEFNCDDGPWIKILISKDHIRDIIYDRVAHYLSFAATHAEYDEPEDDSLTPENIQSFAKKPENTKLTKGIKPEAPAIKKIPDGSRSDYITAEIDDADQLDDSKDIISFSDSNNPEFSTESDALYNNMMSFFDEE